MRRFLGLAVLCATTAVAADPAEFEREWSARRSRTVEAAADMAGIAHGLRLFAERDRLARVILDLVPDHPQARAWLGYRAPAGGSWQRQKGWKPGVDSNSAAKKTLPAERARRLGSVVDDLWTLLQQHEDLAAADRYRAASLLFDLHPDEARFGEATARVLRAGAWIPREAVGAIERRAAHVALGKRLRAEAKANVRPLGMTGVAAKLGHVWTHTVEVDGIRVTTDGGEGEARAIAGACGGALALFRTLVHPEYKPPAQMCVLLVTQADAWDGIIDHVQVPAAVRARYKQLGGAWIPETNHVLQRGNEAQLRLDGAVRQVVESALAARLGETAPAFLGDGLGVYLSWLVTGSRLTYFVGQSRYQEEEMSEERMAASDADWLALSLELSDRERLPPLEEVAGLTLNALGREDSLTAFTFASWLFEGRADDAPRFVHALSTTSFPEALPRVLGIDLRRLDRRLRDWLRATAAPPNR